MQGLSLKFKILVLVGLVSAVTTVTVFAQEVKQSASGSIAIPNCVVPKVLDEKVPFPGKMANLKFDLSEGQIYLLKGTIERQSGKIYFRIDFEFQPYLATAERMLNPLVMIDLSTAAHVEGVEANQPVELALQYVRMQDHKCFSGQKTTRGFAECLALPAFLPMSASSSRKTVTLPSGEVSRACLSVSSEVVRSA